MHAASLTTLGVEIGAFAFTAAPRFHPIFVTFFFLPFSLNNFKT
jgi:hypothetical protein